MILCWQNLNSPSSFSAVHLQNLHALLSHPTPLNSFSPLPSFHRLIISYPTIEAAVATRYLLENPSSATNDNDTTAVRPTTESIFQNAAAPSPPPTEPVKIYFGAPTPLISELDANAHLKAPSLGKLLFISPPPSPPCGWEIRDEDPPNKTTHADDLQRALAGLAASDKEPAPGSQEGPNAPADRNTMDDGNSSRGMTAGGQRRGSASTDTTTASTTITGRRRNNTVTVYHPLDHGGGSDLPQVMVEDTTPDATFAATGADADQGLPVSAEGEAGKVPVTRTARPPVELMEP